MAQDTYLIQLLDLRDGGFYRTLGPAFDWKQLNEDHYYFCQDPETSDQFSSLDEARAVLEVLRAKKPDANMIVVTANG